MEEKMELTELKAEKVMTIRANCPDDMRIPVGKNDFGLLRAIYITGGEFHGARINGTVFPMGGADWNTGFGGDAPEHFTSVEVYARYLLQTDDGVFIEIQNSGKRDKRGGQPYIVTTPRFFAPAGRYEWLNYGAYVGALSGSVKDGVGGVDFVIYRML